jgi:hypothetical protein
MKTREDFIAIIDQAADRYDQVAALRRAGDPRYFQHQEAMATMFAMLSQQIEVAMMEPFNKVRDATVLADAALKGVIPKASSARVKLRVQNASQAAPFYMAVGRKLLDADGLLYEVDSPATIPAAATESAPGEGFVEAVQRTTRSVSHVVNSSEGFYAIEVPRAEDGSHLAGIKVDGADGSSFRYSPGFVNVSPGDLVYTVESDEYQRVFVKFGLSDVVGYQPPAGYAVTLTLTDSNGDVRPVMGSQFSLEYSYTVADGLVTISMEELLLAGSDPMNVAELRELCRHQSAYDQSAVYLGEFDFLVRRNITNLRYLSVWNEQIEESARGASLSNINKLFVSFVEPQEASHAAVFAEIKRLILTADDGYEVVDVPALERNFQLTVSAQVARVHDVAAVTQQIREAILAEYGVDSLMTKRGMLVLQFKRVYEFLHSKIPALQDSSSDFNVAIIDSGLTPKPEHWRFVSPASLTVVVTSTDYSVENWGG